MQNNLQFRLYEPNSDFIRSFANTHIGDVWNKNTFQVVKSDGSYQFCFIKIEIKFGCYAKLFDVECVTLIVFELVY